MQEIKKQLSRLIQQLFGAEIEPEVTVAPENTGADYATNVAMRLAKIAHKSPMVLAEELKASLGAEGCGFEVEVAAPGFLNFYARNEYFSEKIAEYAEKMAIFDKNISPDEYRGKVVVTEFSDPNPFKVLHVGHLYTSIVGDSISRLLELAGAKVVRVNFGGDVGLHVGKTIYALKVAGITPDELTIEKIAECYVEGTRAYEEDEAAKAEIVRLNKEIYRIAALGQEESIALGGDEGEVARLYWRGRELSYAYFDDFYAQIGVKFDKYYPESTVAERGLEEVKVHIGKTYEESDGAIVYRGEKAGLHTRVFINREGVPTYETKDVGLIFTKYDDWKFDESVVITGNEQSDYMKVVLASVNEYAPELVERTQHLTHGMVKLPGNVKMSSRKGNFLRAVDVISMVRAILSSERSLSSSDLVSLSSSKESDPAQPKDNPQMTSSSKDKIALAAIKYALLKYKMGGDIVFEPKESVSMTGNSGVYLLYSAVRAKKILQKAENEGEMTDGSLSKKCVQEEEQRWERRLNKKIVQYEEVISEAVREKAPYKVCNYLYELAQEFSRFYEHVRVQGNVREKELLEVVKAYKNVIEHGLGLLGIEVPEEM